MDVRAGPHSGTGRRSRVTVPLHKEGSPSALRGGQARHAEAAHTVQEKTPRHPRPLPPAPGVGLSPRVRGNLEAARYGKLVPRSIPACAGEPCILHQ